MELIINNDVFKRFRASNYWVNRNGDVYSEKANRIISGQLRTAHGKTYRYIDVRNTAGKVQHINVQRMVLGAWVREPMEGEVIRHLNDDGLDNRLDNLTYGTQKENIKDCVDHGNRVGNVFYLTIRDKALDKTLTFCPARDFADYCGHPNKSGSMNKFFNRHWFKKRYEVLEFRSVNNLKEYQSVTTKGDECSLVG